MDIEPPSELLFSSLVFLFSTSGIIIGLLVLLLLLICSAVISGSEVAFFSLSPSDIQELEDDKSSSSKLILKLKEQPRRLLATILISNNFINIAIVILSEYLIRNMLSEQTIGVWAEHLSNHTPFAFESISQAISFVLTVVVVTFMLVLFGEVIPKNLASVQNVNFAKMTAQPLHFLNRIFSPLSRLLVSWSASLEGGIPEKTGNQLNKDELDRAIALTVEDQIDNNEADILRGIIKFGNVTTKQIMRSRVDVIAIDIEMNYKSLLKLVRECGYSRIPVVKEDFDNVEGILYVKDLIGYTDKKDKFKWQKLIREDLLYVPESKKIDDLLKEFQMRKLHMAIVVDEFGGSAGLVTLEDVMEEVVGEIIDEFDEDDEIEFTKIDDNTFIFEGKSMLNDVCRIIGESTETFDDVKGQSESLGGLILELLGYIPKKKGKEIQFENYKFKIESVSKLRIEKVKLIIDR